MPATLIEDRLGIACVFSDGSTARFALDDLPCPELTRDLLVGLVELIHPHGTVNAAGSVLHYVQSIRHLARYLAAREFTGGATDLRRAQMAEYWMSAPGPKEACTRRLLHGFQLAGGRVDPRLAELAAGRSFNPQRNHRQLPPYPEADWEKLTGVCRAIVDESFARHKRGLAAAARGRHPNDGGWTEDNLLWLWTRIGPAGIAAFGEHTGCSGTAARQRGGVVEASRDLFPDLDVVIAYRLLFGIYSGIVPDGIDDLVTDGIDWAGDATVLLSYVKGRTAAESLNLPRQAVRLLEQWLAHSALLRGHAGAQDRRWLWLRLRTPGGAELMGETGKAAPMAVQRWVIRHDLIGVDGKPLKIHRSRIRTTFLSLRDNRTWTGHGRTTIDPNHSPEVEGDHYLTAATPAQRRAVEAIVEDAQHDLMRRAQPPTVLTEENAAVLVRDYPRLIGAIGLDDTVIAELVGGRRDVFTGACADQLSGLHGPKGKPCPARPWVCLLCPLAVFAPRHAGNLLRLKAFFSRQWQQMPTAHFMAVFGPYSQRIDQVLDRYDPAVLTAAARTVSDHDDELPLRPEESTR
ncbi:hypothetical protein IU459_36305 [Nocardia amamiensis]|uniref:Integrase n=1 Tax=Nocardia amamiensis TaxID=404578 RepID=A0ABS0D6Z9_9NOCA|nr:hypothetical protein [Nocardia amamiensis]MBF6302939.1 hypothetical protein [Nocardia amamiensis]